MARAKISELTALTGSGSDVDADQIPIVDQSATTTKKISVKELLANTPAFLQSGSAVARSFQAKARDFVSATDFGALGDGSTDNSSAILESITYLGTLGGGTLNFPAGTFVVDASSGAIAIALASNVHLNGAGAGVTTIKLKDGANAHVINMASGVTNASVRNLTIDGNKANQTSNVHGVRMAGVTDVWVESCEIKECEHYGVGIQDGTNSNVWLNDLYIHDTGGDGIDIKNVNDDNGPIYIDGVVVKNFGEDSTTETQAGIDLRGLCHVSNVTVSGFPSDGDGVGIRFRSGELLAASGLGAHGSTLTNFNITASGATASGVNVNARDVAVSNGFITGAGTQGLQVADERVKITNVTAEGFTEGFRTATAGSINGNKASFVNCVARANTDGFRIANDDVELIGCRGIDNTDAGIQFDAAADNGKVIGGVVSGNGTAVKDNGTGTKFRNLSGWLNEAEVLSGTFAIDSTGVKSVAITHGLALTPDIQECQLTLMRDTNVSDFVVNFIRVISTSSTVVNAEVNVGTASATGGATAKLALYVRAKC